MFVIKENIIQYLYSTFKNSTLNLLTKIIKIKDIIIKHLIKKSNKKTLNNNSFFF